MRRDEAGRIPGTPRTLVVSGSAAGVRLDRFVASELAVSRSEIQRWVALSRVTVGGSVRDASTKLREGQTVHVAPLLPETSAAAPDDRVMLDVRHVDGDVIVVNKPAGLVVHPARGHPTGTLVNGLLALGLFDRSALGVLLAEGSHERPGIVHRLDKGTSGLMVVARTPEAREFLKAQFQAHTIERAYRAIAIGDVRAQTISTLHGRHARDRLRFSSRVTVGRPAITHVAVVARLHGATHVECRLETGRTHQIRVHLADHGHPILGDALYGGNGGHGEPAADPRVRNVGDRLGHQALHAAALGFVHPRTRVAMRFDAAPPLDFNEALAALREAGSDTVDVKRKGR